MESNKDEALRCLTIAQRYLDADNLVAARKFCGKSISLFKTPQADKLLARINAASASSPSSSSSSSTQTNTTATEEHPSASGMKHRTAASEKASSKPISSNNTTTKEKRDYTPEQHAVVKRVRACKVTEYYEILSVKKDCEETDVKRAYRKLALALHPDKNGAPGADEAFKLVSKAFQVLSDPQKRAAYDRSGGDPEDRFGGGAPADFGSFFNGQGRGRAAGGFDGEISPEELFNMFFGGGGFGGQGTTFTFGSGGPGVFATSFGPGFNNARAQNAADTSPRSLLFQLLPIIILFAFSLLSALPNLFTTPSVPDPRFSFASTARYTEQRETAGHKVPYYVNPKEFQQHPVIGAEIAREGGLKASATGPALKRFEETVEQVYTRDLYIQCQREVDQKNRLQEQEIGIFGFGTDWDKVERIKQKPTPACEELKRMKILKS